MDDAKNFVLGIFQTMKERFGNPLVSAFAVSWAIWNFRLLLVLIGKGEGGWKAKIAYIDTQLMPAKLDWAVHGLLIPTLSAMVWIFVLPPVLRAVAVFHEANHNKARDAIFTATEQRTLSADEALHLRQVMVKQRAEWQTEKAETVQSLENFERRTSDMTKSLQLTLDENTQLKEKIEELTKPRPREKFDFYNQRPEEKAEALGLELLTVESDKLSYVTFERLRVAWPWAPSEYHLFNVKSAKLVKYPLDELTMYSMLYLARVCPQGAHLTNMEWADHLKRGAVPNPEERVRQLWIWGVLSGLKERPSLASQTIADISWFKSVGFMLEQPAQ